jgi:hypothetical protein
MATQGLFGIYDPAAIRQQREEDLTKAAYMASQAGGAYAPMLSAAYRMGDVAGSAIGKLFGMEDPVLKKASLIEDATKAVSNMKIDQTDPKQMLPALIKELQTRGLSEMALPLVKQYQDILHSEADIEYKKAVAEKATKDKYTYQKDAIGNVMVYDPEGNLVRVDRSPLMGGGVVGGGEGGTSVPNAPSASQGGWKMERDPKTGKYVFKQQ